MATLTVGIGETFSTLSSAIAASQDGDVIMVQAGTYTNDFAQINTNITIEGVGGMVNLVATPAAELLQDKAILIINDANVTLDNIELSGAAVSDADGGNGAGIRYQGGNLVLNNCYIHNNQDGLLADSDPTGTITINNSEFAYNGDASGPNSGYTHNLYVNDIAQLTINGSYFHDAVVGHEIKSRAATTIIENSRIEEGPNGTGSYDIDLPNGGNAIIENNVIEKGPNSENPSMIAFGEEGAYANSSLTVTGNTVLNDLGSSATMVWNDTSVTANITNNSTYGLSASQIVNGPANVSGMTTLPTEPALDTSDPFLPVMAFSFACFATGTRVLTGDGELPVEALCVGQQIVVVQSGKPVTRPVKWIGWRSLDLAAHPAPELACPVRIRRGAFADLVPRRDLFLSPDHAVFLDGALIPARLLMNGGTITQDMSRQRIRYYHVELDAHGVILAEGLACESYLDTGNRGVFVNGNAPLALHPSFVPDATLTCWQTDACAPLLTATASVEPVWRRLADRSAALGMPCPSVATTSDPDLRLVVDGLAIRPVRTGDNTRQVFILPSGLPSGATTVRIVSRSAVPAALAPATDDRRRLGVSVRRIVLRRGADRHEMAVDDPALREGWLAVERDGPALWRWTNGDAVLTLPEGIHGLELQIADGMRYPAEATTPERHEAA